jgi:hypothetical protein
VAICLRSSRTPKPSAVVWFTIEQLLVMQDLFVYSLSNLPEKQRNNTLRLGYRFLLAFLDKGGEFEEKGTIERF